MSSNPIIDNSIKQVRNAVYGKDVREAIARALEICYEGNSGDMAREMAERARAAAETAEAIIEDSQTNLQQLEDGIADLENIVVVSENQPTSNTNKIWIRPQADQEYKVATFQAYEALWNRCNDIAATYQQGHGGIVSILRDDEYTGTDNETGASMNRYVVTYSDGTTSEFFMRDGQRGEVGPVDRIRYAHPYYSVQPASEYTGIPPASPPEYPGGGWYSDIPALSDGDYLWTVTVLTYNSGAETYIYGLTRFGINGKDGNDGTGLVNSVSIGNGNSISPDSTTRNVTLPVDAIPTENSNNLMTSGDIYSALQNNAISFENAALTGIPTAPNAEIGTETTQIATTSFVRNEIKDLVPGYAIDGIWLLIATMSTQQLIYRNDWITENVAAFCSTSEPLEWSTTAGEITITLVNKPTSTVTFPLLLVKRRV